MPITSDNPPLNKITPRPPQKHFEIVTPRFPEAAVVHVHALRDARVWNGSYWGARRVIWVLKADYAYRQYIREFGFMWDGKQRRWWTDNTNIVCNVAQYCDSEALRALDEEWPNWKAFAGSSEKCEVT